MKKLKLTLVALTAILFLGVSNVNAQNKTPQTVIIKTVEESSGRDSKMFVIDPSGTLKTAELKPLGFVKTFEQNLFFNSTVLQTEINKWKSEGFEVDAMSHSGYGTNTIIFTTIILSKKE